MLTSFLTTSAPNKKSHSGNISPIGDFTNWIYLQNSCGKTLKCCISRWNNDDEKVKKKAETSNEAKRQEFLIYFSDLNANYSGIIPTATEILKLAKHTYYLQVLF